MKAMSSCSGFLSSFPTLHAGVQGDLAPRARKVKTVLRTEVIPRVKSGDGLKTRFLQEEIGFWELACCLEAAVNNRKGKVPRNRNSFLVVSPEFFVPGETPISLSFWKWGRQLEKLSFRKEAASRRESFSIGGAKFVPPRPPSSM